MAETHVTGVRQREAVEIAGRRYVLRPITYGEAAEIEAERAGAFHGGPAMLNEAVRRALERRHGAEAAAYIAAVDAHEEADTVAASVILTRPHPQEPPEEHARYRAELRAAQAEVLRTARRRALAEATVADDPEVVAERAALARADRRARMALLRASLAAWEGDGLPDWRRERDGPASEEMLAALPLADVEALLARAEALRRPGAVEGKA
ncbi:hypothetical protein GCM10010964_43620 [Caldovatus sediminis]|uniref:Uncharacterized protein n=1 Tax=Caldovatus sediminis TaxID=2041189 RepID=A0A8J2ZFU6_9PROT|nr:hypothetical protein [Caldovatus sediminis]GGG51722.1 hypothetical protein GCM10010964_43620 [Caldovatus sediminis]